MYNVKFDEGKHKRSKDGKFSKSEEGKSDDKPPKKSTKTPPAEKETDSALTHTMLDAKLYTDAAQLTALENYTSEEYTKINLALRDQKAYKAEMAALKQTYGAKEVARLEDVHKRIISKIDSVFAEPNVYQQFDTFRGVSGPLAEKLSKLKPGESFTEPAYTSTSTSRNVAEKMAAAGDKGVVLKITVPPGSSALSTKSVSQESSEDEILLPRNKKFVVTKSEVVGGKRIVSVKVANKAVRKWANNRMLNWRIDADGMMRVTARVLAEGVFPYTPAESPPEAPVGQDGLVQQYIPSKEFTPDALKSLEGKPVIVEDHVWRDVENSGRNGDDLQVGAVAGTPRVDGGYVVSDFVITDKDTIEKIKKGELVEVSAAYDGDCYAQSGIYKGAQFGAVQTDLRFNHVLLLPSGHGRCGHDVRIVNTKPKEGHSMSTTVKRQYGNRLATFTFSNEDDAKEAESMVEEERKFNASELEAAMSQAEELGKQITELQKQYEEAMKVVEAQKSEIDKLMSAESQEAMAQEAAAQTEGEEAILDDAVENEVIEEKEKEEVKNRLGNCKTFADRRRLVVQNALGVKPDEMTNWSQEAVDGSFETLRHRADLRSKRANKSVMGGAQGNGRAQMANKATETLNRIFAPYRLGNRKPGKEA